jgi:hypothetical protein
VTTNEPNGIWQPDWTLPGIDQPYERRGGLLLPPGVGTDSTTSAEPVAGAADPQLETERVESAQEEPVEKVGTDLQLVKPKELAAVETETVDPDEAQAPESEQSWRWRILRRGRDDAGESAAQMQERLSAERALTQVVRDDALARRVAEVEHEIALADVSEQVTAVQRERDERARDAAESEELAALHRRAAGSGERARVRAAIEATAEMRALRVAAVQRVSLWVGLVALLGFGAWSTAGVHEGLAKLLHLEPSSVGWWAGWVVEPLLIAIVAGLIVARAVLRMSGGDVDWRARVAEAGALGSSLALNLFGGWEPGAADWTVSLGQAVAHSVGAIFAALTAWLVGVMIDYTARAKPWEGAPRVSELLLETSGWTSGRTSGWTPGTSPAGTSATAINRGKQPPVPVDRNNLPDDVRKLLDDVRQAIANGILKPDPSGYAIYKFVMNSKGDKTRAGTVSGLVRGWTPPLRAVGGADSAAG